MANQIHRLLGGLTLWRPWRTWTIREWIILAAAAITLLVLTFSGRLRFSSTTVVPAYESSLSMSEYSDWVPFTPLGNARKKAAFCLDGSLPGYHLQKGFGSGSLNWLVHIEGGGWCNSIASCAHRKETLLGSSKRMEPLFRFTGILSNDPLQNPNFFNWNRVRIRYCDGASFSGQPEAELKNGTQLFFRGQLIWEAVMDQLLSVGLSNARQAFLTGCSAGALATLIHCDSFRASLPEVGFRKSLLKALSEFQQNQETGMFISSCFAHCQTWIQEIWHSPASPRINNRTIAESVGDWYFNRRPAKHIDCPSFPCNPTCYNVDFTKLP